VLRCERRSVRTLLTDEDAMISDALNHASIIDGIRLSKAKRLRYANGDMDELETGCGGAGRAADPDRHRRRLLDGRLHREPPGDLRPRGPVRRDDDGR
jgi:glycine C-acetyltransferase